MTVETVSAAPIHIPNPQTPDSDLDTKDLDGHFRADLHASARPYYDRLIALAALWAKTPTGMQVLAQACDLDAVGKRIKFEARPEGIPSPPEAEGTTRTVQLGRHLLETGARDVGVSPDAEHACELMKDVVKALNVLASRIDFNPDPMDPEELASAFRRELESDEQPSRSAPPLRPPPPDAALLRKIQEQRAEAKGTTPPPNARTQTLRSVTSTHTPPEDPSDAHPHNTTIIPPRTEVGRGQRVIQWMQRRLDNVADRLRSVFSRTHAPIVARGATADETPSRKMSEASVTTIRRGSDPTGHEVTYAFLKRDSKEIGIVETPRGDDAEEGASTSAPADRNVPEDKRFKRGHRRTVSIRNWFKDIIPGKKSHEQIPPTRANSLSEARSNAGSFSESTQKRSSVDSQAQHEASDAPTHAVTNG